MRGGVSGQGRESLTEVLRRIAVVNRGEAATRCLRAIRELRAEEGSDLVGIALYTDPDRFAPFVRESDEAISLGPALRGAAEIARQLSRGREAVAFRQGARKNRRPDSTVQLKVERRRRCSVERDHIQQNAFSGLGHHASSELAAASFSLLAKARLALCYLALMALYTQAKAALNRRTAIGLGRDDGLRNSTPALSNAHSGRLSFERD